MANAAIEIVKGASAQSTIQGILRVRKYFVDGLDPSGDPIYEALTADNVPRPDEPDKYIPGIYCYQVVPEPMTDESKRSAIVTATFGPSDGRRVHVTTVKILTTEYQVLTQYDRDGNLIVVNYQPPNGKTRYQSYGQAPQFRAEVTLCFNRIEIGREAFSAVAYENCVNSTEWQGKPAGTWRCTAADASGRDDSAVWERSYVFRYLARGWNKEPVIFRDALTGLQPPDITLKPGPNGNLNGYAVPLLYPEADFGQLKLPTVSFLL